MSARLDQFCDEPWLARVMAIENEERQHRRLDGRMENSRPGAFTPVTHFDWKGPAKVD